MDRIIALYIYDAPDEEATALLGEILADVLPGGTVVALKGTLGAGKTRLVQAVAGGVGVDRRDVLSPTFVLMQHYQGRRAICHIDAYRLRDEDEFLALGPEEYFDGDGLTFIEWADRVEDCLPPDRLDIEIEAMGPSARRFKVSAHGTGHFETVRRIAEAIDKSRSRR